jgi:hypothetical protein
MVKITDFPPTLGKPFTKSIASWMQVLCFVPLTNRAPLDELTHEPRILWSEERRAQPLQGLLHPFMTHAMGLFQHRPQTVDDAGMKTRPPWTMIPSMITHLLSTRPASISSHYTIVSGKVADFVRNCSIKSNSGRD